MAMSRTPVDQLNELCRCQRAVHVESDKGGSCDVFVGGCAVAPHGLGQQLRAEDQQVEGHAAGIVAE